MSSATGPEKRELESLESRVSSHCVAIQLRRSNRKCPWRARVSFYISSGVCCVWECVGDCAAINTVCSKTGSRPKVRAQRLARNTGLARERPYRTSGHARSSSRRHSHRVCDEQAQSGGACVKRVDDTGARSVMVGEEEAKNVGSCDAVLQHTHTHTQFFIEKSILILMAIGFVCEPMGFRVCYYHHHYYV